MKHKNQLALAAWNLQALSDDYRVAAFLTAHDGGDIHAQVRTLLERLAQGQNAQEQAAALYRLIDYLWHNSADDNGEQGALELLSAVEILCRDILYGGDRALRRAEQALDYRLDYLNESTASGDDNPYPAIIRELREQRNGLAKAASGGKAPRPTSGGRESLLALVTVTPPAA